jgi:hypothetical protein
MLRHGIECLALGRHRGVRGDAGGSAAGCKRGVLIQRQRTFCPLIFREPVPPRRSQGTSPVAASPHQLRNWTLCAAGYGTHWPDIDPRGSGLTPTVGPQPHPDALQNDPGWRSRVPMG